MQTLELIGSEIMSDFSDCLSDTTFKALKELNLFKLNLNAKNFAKFEKILLTRSNVIRSISCSQSIGVHSALIPLINQFCPNVESLEIQLRLPGRAAVTLSTVEMDLLKEVGLVYRSQNPFNIILLKQRVDISVGA